MRRVPSRRPTSRGRERSAAALAGKRGRRQKTGMLRHLVRRLVRSIVLVILLPALAVAGVAALVLEPRPRVERPPADATAAAAAYDLLREIRDAVTSGADGMAWELSEAQLNDAFAASARVRPGLAARAEVADDGVMVAASLPLLGQRVWLNADGMVAADEGGLVVAEARLGRLSLPPGLVLPVLSLALDRVLGDDLGRTAIASVERVRTDPPYASVSFAVPAEKRRQIAEGMRQALGASADPGERARVERYLAAYDAAVEEGGLPRRGSALPYLRFAAEAAHDAAAAGGGAQPEAEMRAALLALALYCGDARLGQVIGVPLPRHRGPTENGCADVALAGRTDLRRHFVVSAGLYAASSASAAFGIGELKELMDSTDGGSGFSFDDMAANLAGARFAALLLASGPADWPRIAARMGQEDVVMPPIDDLPIGLTEATFRERFGDVESRQYQALLADIEARVAALPLVREFGG
jgi:hypothetical protein